MSHIVIKVYSFECDADGCGDCADIVPSYRGERILDEARRLLVAGEKWTVRGGCEFCPKHGGPVSAGGEGR